METFATLIPRTPPGQLSPSDDHKIYHNAKGHGGHGEIKALESQTGNAEAKANNGCHSSAGKQTAQKGRPTLVERIAVV